MSAKKRNQFNCELKVGKTKYVKLQQTRCLTYVFRKTNQHLKIVVFYEENKSIVKQGNLRYNIEIITVKINKEPSLETYINKEIKVGKPQ